MGFGTWAWGNQFLWGYSKGMDGELQQVFDLMVARGINLFDTADSYGEGSPRRCTTSHAATALAAPRESPPMRSESCPVETAVRNS